MGRQLLELAEVCCFRAYFRRIARHLLRRGVLLKCDGGGGVGRGGGWSAMIDLSRPFLCHPTGQLISLHHHQARAAGDDRLSLSLSLRIEGNERRSWCDQGRRAQQATQQELPLP